MLKNIRRKVANKISPDKQKEYPFVELNWMSDEKQKAVALASNHEMFERDNGRKAINDEEAITYVRNYVDKLIKEKENTLESGQEQG